MAVWELCHPEALGVEEGVSEDAEVARVIEGASEVACTGLSGIQHERVHPDSRTLSGQEDPAVAESLGEAEAGLSEAQDLQIQGVDV